LNFQDDLFLICKFYIIPAFIFEIVPFSGTMTRFLAFVSRIRRILQMLVSSRYTLLFFFLMV
jgi:hypothetical protein